MIDLISAAGMFASGLLLGGLLLYALSRRKLVPIAQDIERRDLEAKRDALLRQLRELDASNDEEQTRLEQEAAAVLRELEHANAPAPKPSRAAAVISTPPPPANPAMKGFLWGAGSVAAVALLFWLVTSQMKQRTATDQVTGNVPATSNQQPATTATTDPQIQQLEAAVQQNPNDLNLRNDLAKAYLDHENLMAVFEQTKIVLEKSPDNAKALTYQALVRMAMGQMNEAAAMLEKATRSDPSLLDSWVGLAWVRMRVGKTQEAEAAIREAQKQHPEEAARLDSVLQEMKSRAGEATAAAATPPATASGPAVHITLNMEGAPKPGAVIFVLARAEGVTAGPPAAVKRLAVSGFPMTVELSAADSMLGQPLPNRLRIEARLDSDGDAATKDPADPKAAQDGVTVGATVQLTLK